MVILKLTKIGDKTMLHWHQILRHVHELTGKEIEKRAIAEIICYFEPQIDTLIHQCSEELNNLNEHKRLQGLYQKSRIDRECIQRAIKVLNSSRHLFPLETRIEVTKR